MAKQKKVRVEFFLQQKRKPNELGCYPVNIQLFYNRRYSDFPLRQGLYCDDLEKFQQENPEIFEFERRQLTSLVRFEEKRLVDQVTVKGIAAKYTAVHPDVYMLLNQYLNNQLFKLMIRQKPDHIVEIINMDNRISVFSMIEACKKLFEGFESQLPDSLKSSLSLFERYLNACDIPFHFGNRGAKQQWAKRFTIMDCLSGYAASQLAPKFDWDQFMDLVTRVGTWHLDGILGDKPFNQIND